MDSPLKGLLILSFGGLETAVELSLIRDSATLMCRHYDSIWMHHVTKLQSTLSKVIVEHHLDVDVSLAHLTFSTSLYSLQYAASKPFKIIVIWIWSLPERTALATFLGSSPGQNVLYWSKGLQLPGHRFGHPLANLKRDVYMMYIYQFMNELVTFIFTGARVLPTSAAPKFSNTWRPKWLLHKRKRTWRYFAPESLTRPPGRTCEGPPFSIARQIQQHWSGYGP